MPKYNPFKVPQSKRHRINNPEQKEIDQWAKGQVNAGDVAPSLKRKKGGSGAPTVRNTGDIGSGSHIGHRQRREKAGKD